MKLRRRFLNLGICFSLMWMLADMSPANAVPAKPGVITVTQSDGTQLKIRIYGDEFYHYAATTDGYAVVGGGDGDYYFAKLGTDGQLVSTGVKAKPMSRLSSGELSKLGTLRKGLRPLGMTPEQKRLKAVAASRSMSRATGGDIVPEKLHNTTWTAKGNKKIVVIMVEYQDKAFTEGTQARFNRLFNEEGYSDNGATGSVQQYYKENSDGQFIPEFTVVGPYKLSQNRSYYTASGGSVKMVQEAVALADADVNYTEFAESGIVHDVLVCYAGGAKADGSDSDGIWPHRSQLGSGITVDGVTIYGYACACELRMQDDNTVGFTSIGSFAHEFGHTIGWPDYYDTEGDNKTSDQTGIGPCCFALMDIGMYNNNANTPPALGILEKWMQGWAEPEYLTEAKDYTLNPVSDNAGFLVKTETEGDYFLLECRGAGKTVWDKAEYLNYYEPGKTYWGLLVTHIDNTDSQRWINSTLNTVRGAECLTLLYSNPTKGSMLPAYLPSHCFFPGENEITELISGSESGFISRSGGIADVNITDIALDDKAVTFTAALRGSAVDNVSAEAFQRDAVINWVDDLGSSWTVTYRPLNTTDEQTVTVTTPSVHLSQLTPNQTYVVTITSDRDATNMLTFTTQPVGTGIPRIVLSNKKCTSSDPVLLMLADYDEAVGVKWTIDGANVSDPYVTLRKGERRVQAEVTRADGTKEYLVKYVIVHF